METTDGENANKILVIEDEPIITSICYRTLTCKGYEVDVAVNGKIAQRKANKKNYSLYLIDIRIPGMNGMEFFQWLEEKHPETANRVIFTTGDVMSTEITYFLEQSSRPFLHKPFTPDELNITVRSVFDSLKLP